MEPIRLQQKYIHERKEFILGKDGLGVRAKKMTTDKRLEHWDYTIAYDNIGFDTVTKTEKQNRFSYLFHGAIALFFLVIPIVAVIKGEKISPGLWVGAGIAFLFFGITFIISLRVGPKELIYLTGGRQNIELFRNKPDVSSVDLFIRELYVKIREKHKEDYLNAAENGLSIEDHIKWLNYLVSIEAISLPEKENYLEVLRDSGDINLWLSSSMN